MTHVCGWCKTETKIKEYIKILRVSFEEKRITVHLLGTCPGQLCGLEAYYTYHLPISEFKEKPDIYQDVEETTITGVE